ncbi:MAG: hypothetical protein Q7K44_04125 [Candidatus Liptonbacteria bacterium]|nr:hypothetical protein [Candidatus Liptonbacteria bacterium]
MNIVTSLPPLLAGAIGISGSLYGLTADEREFVTCVFALYDQRAEEACEMARGILGFSPTGEEGLVRAAAFMALPANPFPPMKEELLIGLEKQARPKVVLAALRSIVRTAFPTETVGHMLDVFSE